MLRQYLSRPYIQSLIIGILSSVIYKLLNRRNDAKKTNIGFVSLLKVFLASTVAALFVLYTVSFKLLKTSQSGGNIKDIVTVQKIMTGKPSF